MCSQCSHRHSVVEYGVAVVFVHGVCIGNDAVEVEFIALSTPHM